MMLFVSSFPSSSRISSIVSYNFSTSSSSYSDVGMYTCISRIFTGSAFNLIAMILSLQAIFLTTLLSILLGHINILHILFDTNRLHIVINGGVLIKTLLKYDSHLKFFSALTYFMQFQIHAGCYTESLKIETSVN